MSKERILKVFVSILKIIAFLFKDWILKEFKEQKQNQRTSERNRSFWMPNLHNDVIN